MTLVIKNEWLARPSAAFSPFTGLSSQQAQSWTNGTGSGAMVTGDGGYLFIWTPTQIQYFDPVANVWSTVLAMPSGCQPCFFAPVYTGRSMMFDGANMKLFGLDFTAGTVTDTGYVNNFRMRDLPGFNNTAWSANNPIKAILTPTMPGFFGFPVIDLFGNTALMVYDYTAPLPRLACAMKVSSTYLTTYGVCNGSYVEQNPGAGTNGAMLPGRYYRRPGIGQVPLPGVAYNSLKPWFPPVTLWPSASPVPYTQFGTVSYAYVGSSQVDNSALDFFDRHPTTFEVSLQALLYQRAYTATDGVCMVVASLSGLSLASVLHVGFSLADQSFRVPISVAAPSPLNSTQWLLAAMGGTAYVFDGNARLYSLALVQYDSVLQSTTNWHRSPS